MSRDQIRRTVIGVVVIVSLWVSAAAVAKEVTGKIVTQQLDAQGAGYSVLLLWGTHQQMGHAQGYLLAEAITTGVSEIAGHLGSMYPVLKETVKMTVWKPAEIEDEIEGIIAGVQQALPSSTVDAADLKLINTYGDWSYMACRSHSSWGSTVQHPVKTLSTRRLDFAIPSTITSSRHHVLIARSAQDGSSVRWVNLAWPGYVTSVTAVNEYGTLVSLHDHNSVFQPGAHMPRSVATRWVLTMVDELPIEDHLDTAWTALQNQTLSTSTFINYYVPEGHGGVITCSGGEVCHKLRKPQAGYFGGEVLLTCNEETDGLSAPPDDTFMDEYYRSGESKTLQSHHQIMGKEGMHLLSVAYRGRGDMTLWAEGRLYGPEVTPTIKMEWDELFVGAPQNVNAKADMPADGIATSSAPSADPPQFDSGCSLADLQQIDSWRMIAALPVLVMAMVLVLALRRRQF